MSEVDDLQHLVDLHKSGELSDDEFAREKAKVIGATRTVPQRVIVESPEAHKRRMRAEESRARKKGLLFFGVVAGFLILMALVVNKQSTSPTAAPSEEDYRRDAYNAATSIVQNHLKSPSTAEFPSIEKAKVEKNSGHSYTFISYVDATNAFGAKIRTFWTIAIHEQGDKWVADTPPLFDEP